MNTPQDLVPNKDTCVELREIWKDVAGYEGIYKVSNLGRVKSLDRIVSKVGHFNQKNTKWKGKILRPINVKGYRVVDLAKKGTRKKYSIHRLVLVAFKDNPLNKPQVNHINGIKNDNRLENLEWVTQSENDLHSVKLGIKSGLFGSGENNIKSVLTKKQVIEIRSLYPSKTTTAIAKKFNVSHQHISDIINRKKWASI